MVEERSTELDVIVWEVIQLAIEQKGKIQEIMSQGKDFFLEAFPLRREDHFVLLLWSFLNANELASWLDLQTSVYKLD